MAPTSLFHLQAHHFPREYPYPEPGADSLPKSLHADIPLTTRAAATVVAGREVLEAILDRRDPRFFLVVGPCSTHDPKAALDYAVKLKTLADEVSEHLVLVIRPAEKRARSLNRISRNAMVFCAGFDAENPLWLREVYAGGVPAMLAEAGRQLDVASNDTSHLSFSRTWARAAGTLVYRVA